MLKSAFIVLSMALTAQAGEPNLNLHELESMKMDPRVQDLLKAMKYRPEAPAAEPKEETAADRAARGPLNNYLRTEFKKKGIEELFPEKQDAAFAKMESLLLPAGKGKSARSKKISAMEELKGAQWAIQQCLESASSVVDKSSALRSMKKKSYYGGSTGSGKSMPKQMQSDIYRPALMAFMLREYETRQSFDLSKEGARERAMQRYASEADEAFDYFIDPKRGPLKDDESKRLAYDALREELVEGMEMYSQFPSTPEEETSASLILEALSEDNAACFAGIDPKMTFKVLARAMSQVKWTPENRKAIAKAILFPGEEEVHYFHHLDLELKSKHLEKFEYAPKHFEMERSYKNGATLESIREMVSPETMERYRKMLEKTPLPLGE